MRIAVVHDSLNSGGGAERLALYMARALYEAGYDVDLVTIEKTNWARLEEVTWRGVRDYFKHELTVPYLRIPLSLYDTFNAWFVKDIIYYSLKLRGKYDLVMLTKPTHVPILADVAYIHFPSFYPGVETLYYPERYIRNTVLRAYSMLYRLISWMLIKLYREIQYRPLVLTNSSFSKAMIEKWLETPAIVLHPPIDIEKYLNYAKNKQREDLVVSVGRIEKAKGFHIIPYIAKETSGISYSIIGLESDRKYLNELRSLIKKLNLEDRVKIYTNLSEGEKLMIMSRAKVYLHPMKYEHFGIAVVEAMATGLIPIVHVKSGTWIDIVQSGKYGFGCNGEVSDCVDKVLKAVSIYDKLRNNIINYVEKFSYKTFKSNLLKVIQIYSYRNI